jgi:mannose-1-phosphate guanylyltransferase
MIGILVLALIVMVGIVLGFHAAKRGRVAQCQHQWKAIGSYASLKDMDPNDKSGFVNTSQQCVHCQEQRRQVIVFGKDGMVSKVDITKVDTKVLTVSK